MEASLNAIAPAEKPQNGVAGLKYWKNDIVSGLLVSLISLPFSLGIAVASGAPPIAGLISAIIAGMLLPFLGGSFMTISGPAAGLAPVLLASMLTLGHYKSGGDQDAAKAAGYPLLLAVICMVGAVQIVLCLFKAARFSAVFPAAVVEGMLAAIGLLIIAKQLPHLFGIKFEAHEFWEYVREAPRKFRERDNKVFNLGLFCLAFIFGLSAIKAKWIKKVPAPVVMVVVGTIIGSFLSLTAKQMIDIPAQPFKHGIVTPDFKGLFADHSLWLSVLGIVLTLTMIDGVESLATASAVDKIDPFHRKSNPNRTLLAMGVSNICSSVAGGLTIIPGGVKSKANIEGGGRTLWANFYNACFLLIYILVARKYINMIPYAALAAMLIHTGWKLCRPAIWRHVAHIGREQLVLFAATVLVTITTDLLWGIVFGIVAKLVMATVFAAPGFLDVIGRRSGYGRLMASSIGNLPNLFRDPVTRRETADGSYNLYFGRPLVCFNSMHLNDELALIPRDARSVRLHMTDRVTLIDHTSCDTLIHFVEEFERSGRGVVKILGLDRMFARSHYPAAMRFGPPSATVDHAAATADLASLSLTHGAPEELSPEPEELSPEAALARLSLTHGASHAAASEEHPIAGAFKRTASGLGRLMTTADTSSPLNHRTDGLAQSGLIRRERNPNDAAGDLGYMGLARDDHPDRRPGGNASKVDGPPF